MKIKVWVFTIIVCGAVFLGAAGGYLLSQGFSLVNLMAQGIKSMRVEAPDRVQIQIPPDQGGWYQGGEGDDGLPWGGGRQGQPGGYEALPEGFNAGVSIAGTYGEMTKRTEEEVLAAAKQANTDIFGLAKQESKLEELKTTLRQKVTASLDKMIEEGKITEGQKQTYLQRVELILQFAGEVDSTGGALPGNGGSEGDKPDA